LLEHNGESSKQHLASQRIDARSRLQTHVKRGVDNGEVEGQEKDDGLLEKQNPRSTKSGLEKLFDLDLFVLFEFTSVDVTGGLGKSVGPFTQKNGSVCLGYEKRANHRQNSGENGD
jgi:hypothetical protein